MTETKLIKKVLMCEPRFFEVSYQINPWMQIGSIDKKKAYRQWLRVLGDLRDLGVQVEVIEQKEGLPDMVFAADQGVIKGDEVVLSNFRFEQRRRETRFYKEWFKTKNLKIRSLPKEFFLEGGGDCVWLGKKLLVGVGVRSGMRGVWGIRRIWGETEVVPLKLINPYFYHLDTCLFVLNNQTAFYYPEAFSPSAKAKLKKLVANLIPIEEKEACNFAANSVVTDHHVIVQKGNLGVLRELGILGYTGVEADVSEFMKAGGGLHCLTAIIEESLE